MISDNQPPRQNPAAASTLPASEGSYVDWAAILAGGVFALAISFLLITFGSALGLSLTSPYRGEGVSVAWLAIAAGIWFAWVMVSSFGAGGYLAGRMRRRAGDGKPDEVELRDGAHGLMVWATGALVATILAAAGGGGLLGAAGSAAGSAAETAAEVAAEAVPSEYFANVMLRGEATAPADEDAATAEPEAAETDSAQVAAPEDDTTTAAAPAREPAQEATEVPDVAPAVRQEIAGIIARSAMRGEMPERDRSHLAQLVAANTDLDRQAARDRVEEVNAEIDAARATALEAVEDARVAGVVFGFIAAATLLIGAVAAYFAAVAGGHHRDEGLGLDVLLARR